MDPIRAPWAPPTPYAPYGDDASDAIYDLLFADDGTRFEATGIAFGPDAGREALHRLAFDEAAESRIRALAFRSLRATGWLATASEPLPLLGVIVEVGLPEGLDVLAAYADGRARYINHGGGMSVVEGPGLADAEIRAVIEAARPVALAIGPWTAARRPPPGDGFVRLSFLVGDELRFGEGPFDVLVRDRTAGPVVGAATALLARLAALSA
ncbi:MAG TPA: hypothetical protein VF484_11055 [Candidatus Limnocylindrales bacterium]